MRERLEKLRIAAIDDDINACVDLSQAMFLDLSFVDSLQYGITKARTHLVIFEEIHPKILWPHEFLSLLDKRETFNYTIPSFNFHGETGILDSSGRPTPGSQIFIESLDLLKSALEHYLKNWRDIALDLIGGAVNNILVAQVDAHWGRLYPSEYIRYYDGWKEFAQYIDEIRAGAKEDTEKLENIKRKTCVFHENTERKRFHTQLFLELADDIEEIWSKS